MERLLNQIAFIKEIDKIKFIFRKTKLISSNRNENDAEHSWHLAMMAMVLAEHANEPIDLLKVIKMVLIHDIVEIDTGDIFMYDTTRSHTNTEEELKAARRIFGMLPDPQATELLAIWQEFETAETTEARFAKALDKLEPLLQNASNNGGTWEEFDVRYDKVYPNQHQISKSSDLLWQYAEQLIEECVEQGILKR
jgi:Predicted hydrolases of HD superfamily